MKSRSGTQSVISKILIKFCSGSWCGMQIKLSGWYQADLKACKNSWFLKRSEKYNVEGKLGDFANFCCLLLSRSSHIFVFWFFVELTADISLKNIWWSTKLWWFVSHEWVRKWTLYTGYLLRIRVLSHHFVNYSKIARHIFFCYVFLYTNCSITGEKIKSCKYVRIIVLLEHRF